MSSSTDLTNYNTTNNKFTNYKTCQDLSYFFQPGSYGATGASATGYTVNGVDLNMYFAAIEYGEALPFKTGYTSPTINQDLNAIFARSYLPFETTNSFTYDTTKKAFVFTFTQTTYSPISIICPTTTCTITVVGGGGGGGGGIAYQGTDKDYYSVGGGGGGGGNYSLVTKKSKVFTISDVIVGSGGSGGYYNPFSVAGTTGGTSEVILDTGEVISATGGNPGGNAGENGSGPGGGSGNGNGGGGQFCGFDDDGFNYQSPGSITLTKHNTQGSGSGQATYPTTGNTYGGGGGGGQAAGFLWVYNPNNYSGYSLNIFQSYYPFSYSGALYGGNGGNGWTNVSNPPYSPIGGAGYPYFNNPTSGGYGGGGGGGQGIIQYGVNTTGNFNTNNYAGFTNQSKGGASGYQGVVIVEIKYPPSIS
jgi:hypothetical protein